MPGENYKKFFSLNLFLWRHLPVSIVLFVLIFLIFLFFFLAALRTTHIIDCEKRPLSLVIGYVPGICLLSLDW